MWQLWVVASCRLVCPINIAHTRTAVAAGSGKRELSDKLRKQNTRMTKIVSSVSICEQLRPSQLEAPLYRRCSKLVVSACVCVLCLTADCTQNITLYRNIAINININICYSATMATWQAASRPRTSRLPVWRRDHPVGSAARRRWGPNHR